MRDRRGGQSTTVYFCLIIKYIMIDHSDNNKMARIIREITHVLLIKNALTNNIGGQTQRTHSVDVLMSTPFSPIIIATGAIRDKRKPNPSNVTVVP